MNRAFTLEKKNKEQRLSEQKSIGYCFLFNLPETNSSKMDGRKTFSFPFGARLHLAGAIPVSFRECISVSGSIFAMFFHGKT